MTAPFYDDFVSCFPATTVLLKTTAGVFWGESEAAGLEKHSGIRA